MKYCENLDHHSESYNPINYNGMDYNDYLFEKSLDNL